MKEIGKLLELLNEYDKEKGLHTFWKTTQSNKIQIYGKGVCSESYLYSKSYGFIKWLVENDKIEGETIGNYQSRTKLRTLTHTAGLWHDAEGKSELEYIKETFTDGLLMLLSISDTPIEDLISYLK